MRTIQIEAVFLMLCELSAKERPVAKKPKKASSPYGWAAAVFCLAVGISAALSLGSQSLLSDSGLVVACVVLTLFILLGIVFDVIGVAVTAADPRPLHSMASHRERGAKEALALLRSAGRVSSVCNDVVGDICGIVSGVTAAVIVSELHAALNTRNILISVGVTAVISGLTIGGKALSKTFAIRESANVVFWVGKVLYCIHTGAAFVGRSVSRLFGRKGKR